MGISQINRKFLNGFLTFQGAIRFRSFHYRMKINSQRSKSCSTEVSHHWEHSEHRLLCMVNRQDFFEELTVSSSKHFCFFKLDFLIKCLVNSAKSVVSMHEKRWDVSQRSQSFTTRVLFGTIPRAPCSRCARRYLFTLGTSFKKHLNKTGSRLRSACAPTSRSCRHLCETGTKSTRSRKWQKQQHRYDKS